MEIGTALASGSLTCSQGEDESGESGRMRCRMSLRLPYSSPVADDVTSARQPTRSRMSVGKTRPQSFPTVQAGSAATSARDHGSRMNTRKVSARLLSPRHIQQMP
jgi:hypothetical protein